MSLIYYLLPLVLSVLAFFLPITGAEKYLVALLCVLISTYINLWTAKYTFSAIRAEILQLFSFYLDKEKK